MTWKRVEWRACILLCSASLFAQAPQPESFYPGELTKVLSHPDVPSYEYTIWNGVDDAFTGATTVAIRVREGTQVKYRITNGSIYIIDDDGKIQQTRYIRQAEMVRIKISEEDLGRLTDRDQTVRSEIPQVLDLKAPSPVTAPPPDPKRDAKKAEPKKKAKPQSSN